MSKVDALESVSTGTSGAAVINANSTKIATAFQNTLSRDGSSPNFMTSSLDMNSNRIINLPAPVSATDAARLQDITSVAVGGLNDLATYTPGFVGSIPHTIRSKLQEVISVKDFGAAGDGSDATAAFNLAIAYAQSITSGAAGTYIGVSIQVPNGRYLLSAALTNITNSGITFIGESRQGAIILVSSTGALFTWAGGAYSGGLESMTVRYPSNPNGSASVITISNAGALHFENLQVENCNTFATLGTDASHTCAYVTFRNIIGYVYNSGHATFRARWGVGLNIHGVSMYVNGVGVPAGDRVSTMTTVAGTRFLEYVDGSWDTTIIDGNTQTNRYFNAIYISAPGSIISNMVVDHTVVFDYNSGDAVSLNAVTNASGGVININIHSYYIFSWSGHGIFLSGDNPNRLHNFSGACIAGAGKDGVHISGAATGHIVMDDMQTISCNRINGGYANINIAGATSNFSLVGGVHTGFIAGLSFPWQADYIIIMGADCNVYNLSNLTVIGGAIAGWSLADNTSASAERFIGNNTHADYYGVKTTGMFTTPATTVSKFNFSPFKVQVCYRFLDDLVVNGQQVYGAATPGTVCGIFEWMPGEQFTAYYTAGGQIHYWIHP